MYLTVTPADSMLRRRVPPATPAGRHATRRSGHTRVLFRVRAPDDCSRPGRPSRRPSVAPWLSPSVALPLIRIVWGRARSRSGRAAALRASESTESQMPHNGAVATDATGNRLAAAATTAADRWRRSAVVGALWAASEIVLGSFLHNLRVPLRGHLLTLVAVALLAATRRRWPVRGVAWRAGLVAAVMKSVSPSAVLLGPMIAITMEGLLFEAGVRIGRRGALACAIGGGLAMTWTFLHQVGSLLIAFGPDLVEVYRRLVAQVPRIAELPLGGWTPVAAVLALELAAGAGAALLGWRAAGRAHAATAAGTRSGTAAVPRVASRPGSRCGRFSWCRSSAASAASWPTRRSDGSRPGSARIP